MAKGTWLVLFPCAVALLRAPAQPFAARRVGLGSDSGGFDGGGFDGGDVAASGAYDHFDDDGWRAEGEEEDAGVQIRSGVDGADEPVDAASYFFGDADDDAELEGLLAALEEGLFGREDDESRAILASVRTCAAVLAEEEDALDSALDARAALAFAVSSRGDAPGDVEADDAGDLVAVDRELAEAYALVDDEPLDASLDEMYGWLLKNASTRATAAGGCGRGASIGVDLGTTNSAAAVCDDGGAPALLPPGLVPSVVGFVDGGDSDENAAAIALRDDEGAGVGVLVGHAAEALRGGPHSASRVVMFCAQTASCTASPGTKYVLDT